MNKEQYNIYNLLSFSLKNNTHNLGFFNNINSKYKYFKSETKCKNHFEIIVDSSKSKDCKVKLQKGNKRWAISLNNYYKKSKIHIYPREIGFRKFFSFTALKNLYVRSLLMDKLLDVGAALVHSAAFKISNKAAILAGRPGVFKTTILMDAIRLHKASFIGEENCLIRDKKVYPFPLNIDSISFKIDNYIDENPSGKLQKVKLGLHLLKGNNESYNLNIADVSCINTVFFLEKGGRFQIKPISFEDLLPKLIENEIKELSLPPTHTLSGINYNYFFEEIKKENPSFESEFREKLGNIFTQNFKASKFYIMTSPKVYTKEITEEIIKLIKE